MGDFKINTSKINEDFENATESPAVYDTAIDPLMVKALGLYKRAHIGNDIHKYWFAFSCPIGLVSISIQFN